MAVLTLIALYANAHWMTRTLRLDTAPHTTVTAADDRSVGGKSLAAHQQDTQGHHLTCTIVQAYQWPYCQMNLNFGNPEGGVNFNDFDFIRLRLSSHGVGPNEQIRIFLRNFNPAYSKPGDFSSLKPQELSVDPNSEPSVIELRLNQFAVATWWAQEHPTSLANLGPQFDQISEVNLSTSGTAGPGEHHIRLESFELVGQWVTPATFRLGVIFIWLAVLVFFLVWEWRRSTLEVRKSALLQQQLHGVNAELESRVEERTRALAQSNTRLIEAMQTLDSARHELVQNEKNAALGALVSGIAHELNTPLGNAVLVSSTLADMLKNLELSSRSAMSRKTLNDFFVEARRGIEILEQNLARSATLIASFKQLSADQHSEQRRDFSLAQVANETSLAMMHRIRQTSHDLRIEIDPTITLNAYPGPLSQIFIILINNSLLHAFEGIAQGTMVLTAQLAQSDSVTITFSDNGNGIGASILRRVFEPFFTTKLGKGGSGLGLHLAHTFVTQVLGGKIDVHSAPGDGTRFVMVLPLVAPVPRGGLVRIGVPKDVLDDYTKFLNGRLIQGITQFTELNTRRDVVELSLFMQALLQRLPDLQVELCPTDNYAMGIEQLRAGTLAALATTSWKSDLESRSEELNISDAVIEQGQTLVGIYASPANAKALSCRTLADLQQLRIASNNDWSADWATLIAMGITHRVNVKTWPQMVYMASSGEVDAVLAPFSKSADLSIVLDGCTLVPIPNQRVCLQGTRHYATAKTQQGQLLADAVFPQLLRMREDGTFVRAMRECGFINTQTEQWAIVN